ncbi:MAG TPA: molecular chaperone HtpG [Chitinophagaceae bacterium]|nr:molecular chaperone HtpG [Chitinophagaceae bacterium]
MAQKGKINVETGNIFPIIKKFLYSDHEIFLRELISNAVDATQKVKTLSGVGEFKGELGDLRIDVKLDEEKKTITISDHGIGMTEEEVEKYINEVAFSGAESFLDKYKDKDAATIIGHFGLGFYSSFMVSEKVEIISKSWQEDAKAVRWECNGDPEFEMEETEKEERGTDIVLHVNEESKEFLSIERISSILKKFCKFLPIPIYFINKDSKEDDKPINNTNPIWTKKPADLTKQDYQDFYNELYPFSEAPLFWIHLNVDYPFHLTGILYFPKIKNNYEVQKDRIQLYSNQVFVTDEVKDIVPEFLMLLHGVIDSPDIPLNVSRSYLQGDPNVRKINNYITRKVADKLSQIFKKDRKEFESKWESIGLFVKYGMLTDEKFFEKAGQIHLMKDASSDKFYTLEEYKEATKAIQTDKEEKNVILYTTDAVQQNSYIKAAEGKGYKVVLFDSVIDSSFISQMEMKWENVRFTRVDADIVDHLINKEETLESTLSKEEEETLQSLFDKETPDKEVKIELKGLSENTPPVIATRSEMSRRLKEMAQNGGQGMNFYGNMPDEVTLTVNTNHPIYRNIIKDKDSQKQENYIHNLADLALLSQGMLQGEKLTNFVDRSINLMDGNSKSNIIVEP